MDFTSKELKTLGNGSGMSNIARRLGTSRITVWRVLSGKTNMTTKLQKAIMEEARQYLNWLNERKKVS